MAHYFEINYTVIIKERGVDMTVLEVKNLKRVYASKHGGNISKALDNVNFQVEKGEFVGIMGPSGAGKIYITKYYCNY